ncbi:MAG: undecaprenyl phosphate translocase family protein [Oscillospiraceae bacterium]
MNKRTFSKRHIAENILLALKGALVGFGAIMPGISGGTLCVAFGMYQPLIEVFSHPRQALQKHWLSLCVFLFGAGIGFIGLSGLAGWLLEQNSQAVTCAFIGLIVGTIPELWRDAGQKGRRPSAYFAMVAGFTLMLSLLLLFRQIDAVSLRPDFWGFLFCGVMWGVSFIVPGLSSSTLLLFRIVSTARRNLPPVPGRSAPAECFWFHLSENSGLTP